MESSWIIPPMLATLCTCRTSWISRCSPITGMAFIDAGGRFAPTVPMPPLQCSGGVGVLRIRLCVTVLLCGTGKPQMLCSQCHTAQPCRRYSPIFGYWSQNNNVPIIYYLTQCNGGARCPTSGRCTTLASIDSTCAL